MYCHGKWPIRFLTNQIGDNLYVDDKYKYAMLVCCIIALFFLLLINTTSRWFRSLKCFLVFNILSWIIRFYFSSTFAFAIIDATGLVINFQKLLFVIPLIASIILISRKFYFLLSSVIFLKANLSPTFSLGIVLTKDI